MKRTAEIRRKREIVYCVRNERGDLHLHPLSKHTSWNHADNLARDFKSNPPRRFAILKHIDFGAARRRIVAANRQHRWVIAAYQFIKYVHRPRNFNLKTTTSDP